MGSHVVSSSGQPAMAAFPFVRRILDVAFRDAVEALLSGRVVRSSSTLELHCNLASDGRHATITLTSFGAASKVVLELEAIAPSGRGADPRPSLPMLAWRSPYGAYDDWELYNCRVLNILPVTL
jgi:hypothetical protein